MSLKRINEIKKSLGITSEELSKKSGVPLGTLNKILSGQTSDPKFFTLKAIAKALNCTVDDFDDTEQTDKELHTVAAHFEGSEYTEDELNEIKEFAKFVKSKRK